MKQTKTGGVSALEAHLGYWLRFVSNQVSQSFGRKLSDVGIGVAEWVILREMFEAQPLVPSELAAQIGMTRGAVSKIIGRLSEKSLVIRIRNDEDRRFEGVTLSAKGRALVPKLAALADQNDREFFGHLKASERLRIERIMREIVRRHGLSTVPVD